MDLKNFTPSTAVELQEYLNAPERPVIDTKIKTWQELLDKKEEDESKLLVEHKTS